MKFVPDSIARKSGLMALKTQKHSPTLLFGAGVVGVIGTVVLASKATLKVGDILEETEGRLEQIRLASDTVNEEKYSDKDAMRDRVVVYTQSALNLTKLYGPAVILGTASIGALAGSHVILTRRNAALTMAFTALDRTLNEYRDRVRAEVGEEKEENLWTPTETVTVVGEDGKKTKVERTTGTGGSPYAVVFDQLNPNWKRTQEYNPIFLSAQQNYANDLLRSRGHVFLNEVYGMLGFPHTKAGQIVGWVCDDPQGDNYVDFGIFRNDEFNGKRFVAGETPGIWLDFNVDGNILDKI